MAIVALEGATTIEVTTGGVTMRPVEPVTVPELALIVVVPWPIVFVKPFARIVATPVAEEAHVTEFVRSWRVPLL